MQSKIRETHWVLVVIAFFGSDPGTQAYSS